MSDDDLTKVIHEYRIVIPVTKENHKDLQREHNVIVRPGDTLTLPFDTSIKPTPTVVETQRKVARELGGVLEYRRTETWTKQTEWAEPLPPDIEERS